MKNKQANTLSGNSLVGQQLELWAFTAEGSGWGAKIQAGWCVQKTKTTKNKHLTIRGVGVYSVTTNEMEKGCPKRHGVMHSGRPCCPAVECGQRASVGSSSWVHLPVPWAQRGSATRGTLKGPTGWLWPVGPAWQPALLLRPILLCSSPWTGVPLSSVSWPHTLQGLLLQSVTSETQQTQETANSGPQEWQRLGLLEIELQELCIKAFEEIKGYNFSNEYIIKNDPECTGGFFNMELLEEKIQSLK